MEEQDIQKIQAALKETKTIAIVFHFNPDGDALGSALALYHYFQDEGYEASVISPNPFPNFLKRGTGFRACHSEDMKAV